MLKKLKAENNYLICNIDEPYAPKMFEVLKSGEKSKNWLNGWIEEEDFLGWCRETFGGQFIPYLVVNGNSGPWLSMEDFYSNSLRRNESWQEEIKNIIFYECCEGDELELSAHGLPTLEYIDNYMKFKYVNIQHCEEKVLWGSKKNPIVKIEWMWVEEKDLMREWSGF